MSYIRSDIEMKTFYIEKHIKKYNFLFEKSYIFHAQDAINFKYDIK